MPLAFLTAAHRLPVPRQALIVHGYDEFVGDFHGYERVPWAWGKPVGPDRRITRPDRGELFLITLLEGCLVFLDRLLRRSKLLHQLRARRLVGSKRVLVLGEDEHAELHELLPGHKTEDPRGHSIEHAVEPEVTVFVHFVEVVTARFDECLCAVCRNAPWNSGQRELRGPRRRHEGSATSARARGGEDEEQGADRTLSARCCRKRGELHERCSR